MSHARDQKPLVLLVDDEEDLLALLSAILEIEVSCRVRHARSGEEALEMAVRDSPSVIVLDLALPKMSGVEVCRTLKATPATAHIPIIVLTALAQEGDRERALHAGADDYLTKPFAVTEIVDRVARRLGR